MDTGYNPPPGSSFASAAAMCAIERLNFCPSFEFENASPSLPTTNSVNATPFFSQVAASLSLIALDAFVISGCSKPIPAQNNFIPPPEPVDSTIGAGFPCCANFSATIVENG